MQDTAWLGATIAHRYRFGTHSHITRIVDKCKNRVIIKCMPWKNWGNSLQIQMLYLQFTRSCFEHASNS